MNLQSLIIVKVKSNFSDLLTCKIIICRYYKYFIFILHILIKGLVYVGEIYVMANRRWTL